MALAQQGFSRRFPWMQGAAAMLTIGALGLTTACGGGQSAASHGPVISPAAPATARSDPGLDLGTVLGTNAAPVTQLAYGGGALAAVVVEDGGPAIRLWRGAGGAKPQPLTTTALSGSATSLRFEPLFGKFLAAVSFSAGSALLMADPDTGAVTEFPVTLAAGSAISVAAVDAGTVAVGTSAGQVAVFPVADGRIAPEPAATGGELVAVDSLVLAEGEGAPPAVGSGGGGPGGEHSLYALDRQQSLVIRVSVRGPASAQGAAGAAVSFGEALRAGEGAGALTGDRYGRGLVTNTTDGQLLLYSNSNNLLVLRQRYPVPGRPYAIAAGPQLTWVSITETNTAQAFELTGGEPIERAHVSTIAQPYTIAVADDGTVFVGSAAGGGIDVLGPEGQR